MKKRVLCIGMLDIEIAVLLAACSYFAGTALLVHKWTYAAEPQELRFEFFRHM